MRLLDLAERIGLVVTSDYLSILAAHNFDDAIEHLQEAYAEVAEGLSVGSLVGENDVTAAQTEGIRKTATTVTTLDGEQVGSVQLQVRRYKSWRTDGKPAEETLIGADFGIKYVFEGADSQFTKGVLVQAKLAAASEDRVYLRDIRRAQDQARTMLQTSAASIVQIYHPLEPRCYFVPASAFATAGLKDSMELQRVLDAVYYQGSGAFYEQLLKCPIGDAKLDPMQILDSLSSSVAYEASVSTREPSLKEAFGRRR